MTFSRRALLSGLAALSVGFAVVADAHAQAITVKHGKGETTIPATPKTVVVFDAASLDTLDTLGVAIAAVPRGLRAGHLAKFGDERYPKVGTLFEPDYEAVAALAPDLIVVGGRSGAKYADLAKIAPTIDLTADNADFLGSLQRNVTTLGRIFGKEAEAKAKLDALRVSMDALKAKAASAGKGLLVLTTGGRMSAYGPGSRFGLLHTLGVVPALTDLKVGRHGQPISFELIRTADPDWLFVIDRDAAIGREGGAAKLLDNELVSQTTAWRKKQVVYLDPANWYLVGGGLTAMQATVDQLSQAFSRKD